MHRDEEPSIISFNACRASDGKLGNFPVGPFSTSVDYFRTLSCNSAAVKFAIVCDCLSTLLRAQLNYLSVWPLATLNLLTA
jgi:hypothetical protein